MNSREKGKRGERQWRDELRAHGYAARRGQQFSGSADSPDVVCEALGWIHFEVKLTERLDIYAAMEQARRDVRGERLKAKGQRLNGEGCAIGKVPIVAHRKSYWPWLVTMEAERFYRFLRMDMTGEWVERMASASPATACAGLAWVCCVQHEGNRLNIHEVLADGHRESNQWSVISGQLVVVAHRRNGSGWLVTMGAETFFGLLRGDFTGGNGANGGPGGRPSGNGKAGKNGNDADRVARRESGGRAISGFQISKAWMGRRTKKQKQ